MKAAVMRAQNAPLEIEEVEIDSPAPGEVLVKTAASGIGHSDLHMITGDIPIEPPCILGHESAGIVHEVAAGGGADFVEGDHVIGCVSAWCGVTTALLASCLPAAPKDLASRVSEVDPLDLWQLNAENRIPHSAS